MDDFNNAKSKERLGLTRCQVEDLYNIVVDAHEYYRIESESLTGYPTLQERYKEPIEDCRRYIEKFKDFLGEENDDEED